MAKVIFGLHHEWCGLPANGALRRSGPCWLRLLSTGCGLAWGATPAMVAAAEAGIDGATYDGPKVVPLESRRRRAECAPRASVCRHCATRSYRPLLRRPGPAKVLPDADTGTLDAPAAEAPLAPDAEPDPELRRHEPDRCVHRRDVRRGLAAGPQRRRRTQPLHPGGQRPRTRSTTRPERCSRRSPRTSCGRRGSAAVQRQFAGRSGRRSTTALADRWILTPGSRSAIAAASGLAVLPMHRGLEDRRPGRRRLVALCRCGWIRAAPGSRPVGDAQRLRQVRHLARLPVHGRQRIHVTRRRHLHRRRVRVLQPRRPVQRRAADLVARLPRQRRPTPSR